MADQHRYNEIKKASIVSIIGNIVLMVIKGIIGYFAGSTALVADALHSASDLFGSVVLLQGLKIASRPPDEAHPYGHHRAESITSKLLAIILAITAIGIGNEAINILRSGEIIPPKPIAVYIALISVIIKEMMYQYTVRIGRKVRSSAVIADAWNHRSDALSSIATVIGITGAIWGFAFMDPVAGIVVSILILRTAVYIYIEAIHSLMDKAPAREVLDSIRSAAKEARGVKAVQEVKVRQYGSKYVVDMKICVDPNITVEEGHGAAARAKENILNVNRDVLDVLIHVNPCFSDPIKEACKECSEKKNSPS